MRMAVCGGTGFIGSALVSYWLEKGHEIIIVTRKSPASDRNRAATNPTYITWEELKKSPETMEGLDALVNLAGSSLNQRWTEKGKKRILDSRLQSVQAIAALLGKLQNKPGVIVQGSAVGIYGTSLTEVFDENSPTLKQDFLSEVTLKWEHEAESLTNQAIRLVTLRTGVVLGNQGGAYPLMRLPYLLGIGGRVGTGQQWMSWIHLKDMVRLIDYSVMNPAVAGPINAVSPSPVTNEEFGRTTAKAINRPYWFPLPALLLKTLLGEQSTLLLDGQRVMPRKALELGFTFQFPTLMGALNDLKGQK
ncbi:TIGR01777 family protein [Paenibacillus zeisoli]|uniref:TIGR01777 family protein n=1 Tax=Paenibacillus zeisoli TaxID=2496267 RepID=A0A3S1B3L7_9BACL|nr:TIGR01777 family oxidoreductase [Paenibacillus zeisoli]RUT28385.1 TIGR01777 family protein [Paenibacillus zeisoli]